MTINQSDILPEVAAITANNVHVFAFWKEGDLLQDDVDVLACRVRERGHTHKVTFTVVSCPDPTSHEEKGLATIEQFLGCAESTVLKLDKPMK